MTSCDTPRNRHPAMRPTSWLTLVTLLALVGGCALDSGSTSNSSATGGSAGSGVTSGGSATGGNSAMGGSTGKGGYAGSISSGGSGGDAQAGQGQGGAGGEVGSLSDHCPGTTVPLTLDAQSTLIRGSTRNASRDTPTYCSESLDSDAADVFYALQPEAEGTLELTLSPAEGTKAPALAILGTCSNASSIVDCAQAPEGNVSLKLLARADETLYALIEAGGVDGGDFSFSARLTSASCGDEIVNLGEQCDFGDTEPGDGCSATCQYEAPSDDSDVCPGQVQPQVTLDRPLSIASHTVGYSNKYTNCDAKDGAPDRVFAVNAGASGMLQARVAADFDVVLSVHQGCLEQQLMQLLGCADSNRAMVTESLTLPVTQGEQYFIVVDGYVPQSMGQFDLDVEFVQ